MFCICFFLCFKQKTAYEMRISDWSSDVCSSDLARFTAGPGLTALFGPSGAGKTSILNMVAGLLRPDRGHIRIGDRTLFDGATDLRPEARRVGYVFQDDRLFPHRRVRANLIYGLDLALPANRWMSLDEATQFLGIGHLLGRWPQSLSGGEAQRVAIGRSEAHTSELQSLMRTS